MELDFGTYELHVPLMDGWGVNADYLLTNVDTSDMQGMQPVISIGATKTL